MQLRAGLCCVQVAVARLEAAKEIEDGMAYQEPPRLYQPIRHCLGYVLSNVTGDHAGAEQVGFPLLPSRMALLLWSCCPALQMEEAHHSSSNHEPEKASEQEATDNLWYAGIQGRSAGAAQQWLVSSGIGAQLEGTGQA